MRTLKQVGEDFASSPVFKENVSVIEAVVDDPDIEQIIIISVLKPDKDINKCSVIFQERALLSFIGKHIPCWTQYNLDKEFKTIEDHFIKDQGSKPTNALIVPTPETNTN